MTLFNNYHIQLNQQGNAVDATRGYKSSVCVSQISEQDNRSTVDKWVDIDTFRNEYGFYQDTAPDIKRTESLSVSLGLHQPTLSATNVLQILEQQYSNYVNNVGSSSDGGKGKEVCLPPASLDLFKHHLTESKSCKKEPVSGRENPKLSTEQIMRLAAERFVEFASHMFINIDVNTHPYSFNLKGLTVDDKMDVELVQLLLTVVEKVSLKQTDKACRLLSNCRKLASNIGTPVQRVVFYFAEALSKKIERETGRNLSTLCEKSPEDTTISTKLKHQNAILAYYKTLPFPQVLQFAGVETILESIKMNSKVHVIDIKMRIGATWAIVMQALDKQDGYIVKQLKLTVIETSDKEAAEAACTHLKNFSESLNLRFCYHIILLSDMKDLQVSQFEVEADEVIVAYAPYVLRTMISRPTSLERLMTTMKQLNPSVMVITEVEANHNSPSFVNRFVEAFFYHGANFDILEDIMERNDENRMALEAGIFRLGIHNIVATEGTERFTRSVKIEVWRAFFERFGMVETKLSQSTLYEAQLVLQSFPCVKSCSLEKKGKGLAVGWKGTPLFTLSAWSFS
ncbi:hypothetical protein Leryth_011218 [Lithospermum erythrorhizon]|nr:hypothetical protein Leryth_011218 [Lithospermum erythrorhizon]